MKLLTKKQKQWLLRRNIEINRFYMFPRFGFTIYSAPNLGSYETINTNPFTKSLDHEYFVVKEKVNGFVRGNFQNKPHGIDFYLYEEDLAQRDMFEHMILLVVCFLPMLAWNYLWVGKNKAFN